MRGRLEVAGSGFSGWVSSSCPIRALKGRKGKICYLFFLWFPAGTFCE